MVANDDRATIFYLPVQGLGIFLGREGQFKGPDRATQGEDQGASEESNKGLMRTD
jgi:hypothetical protein